MPKRKSPGGNAPLAVGMTADAAIAAILTMGQAELVATMRAALDRPRPDTVHALRMALQRLGAGLELCAGLAAEAPFETARRDARALSDGLGEARNWDIFISETLARRIEELAGTADIAALTEGAATARHESYRRTGDLLAGPLPQKLLLGLALLLSQTPWREADGRVPKRLAARIEARARREIARADRRLRENGKRLSRLSDEERREVDGAVRQFAHALACLAPLWPRSARLKRYRDRVLGLQAGLDELAVMSTTQRLLEHVAADDFSPVVQRAAGAMSGWAARDKLDRLAALDARWRDFRNAKRFW